MPLGRFALLAMLLGSGCATTPQEDSIATAERFIDAFYSWQADALAATLEKGEDADRALYYQAWAEAGNYAVQTRRPCAREEDGVIQCAITVTDDIGGTLGYIATDTFHLSIADGLVRAVTFTADDPPILEAVFEYLSANNPEVFAGPCKDMFAGGTTPRACVRAVIDGAQRYLDSRNN